MTDIVMVGGAIEGMRVGGHSRDPLKCDGMVEQNGLKCLRFTATFAVVATILEEITVSDLKRLEPDACCTLDATIRCEKSVIHTTAKHPNKETVAKASASHKASHWHFPKQTSARVDRGHIGILAALTKRSALHLPSTANDANERE